MFTLLNSATSISVNIKRVKRDQVWFNTWLLLSTLSSPLITSIFVCIFNHRFVPQIETLEVCGKFIWGPSYLNCELAIVIELNWSKVSFGQWAQNNHCVINPGVLCRSQYVHHQSNIQSNGYYFLTTRKRQYFLTKKTKKIPKCTKYFPANLD